jgi:hypothetical protein
MLKTIGIVLLVWVLANAAVAVGALAYVVVEWLLSGEPL